MCELLIVSSKRNASDERDKVFAILGHVDGGQPSQVDYRKSLIELHFDVLLELILSCKDFEFLTWTQREPNEEGEVEGWPSWLPKSWHGDFTLINYEINREEIELPGFRISNVKDLGLPWPEQDQIVVTSAVTEMSFAWNLVRHNKDLAKKGSNTKPDLGLWDDQLIADFAALWRIWLFSHLCLSEVVPVSFLDRNLPVVRSAVATLHSIFSGAPFPDPGDDVDVAQMFQISELCLMKERNPEKWTESAECLRREISRHRPGAKGADAAAEMLAPLMFLAGNNMRF